MPPTPTPTPPASTPTQAAGPRSAGTLHAVAERDFEEAAARYRRELLAHCYRMVGSPAEAEDLVQETYLRAWRAYDSFEGRASLRTWLHRIATNVCLTSLEGAGRRPLPTGLGAEPVAADTPLNQRGEIPWLGPLPDAMLGPVDPAEAVGERDRVRLAFAAALQHLPARQRAVLILREVLRWSAAEVAEAMETTVPAVNSALQRARATLAAAAPDADAPAPPLTAGQRRLLDAYVEAFWRKDVAAIAALLTGDAVWEMPPFDAWYQGPETIAALIGQQCPGGVHDMPMVATTCNGQPAFGLYMREPGTDRFTPFQLQVLELVGDRVAHVVAFFDPAVFALAALPPLLTRDDVAQLSGT